jgi:5'-nucleotidase (lipoprotein e(P4) family)
MTALERFSTRFLCIGVAAAISGCAGPISNSPTTVSSSPAPALPPAAATIPANLRWTRASAEHRALYLQIYGNATREIERAAAGRAAGTWGVIMDADETVIDNSLYEQELALAGRSYTDSSWAAWVRREAAPALPGAAAFTRRVHELGGRVAIVTGRADGFCPETRANLLRVGIAFDEVLCQVGSNCDKNPRFDAIQAGRAPSVLPPMDVLMWIGDNIQDFPHLSQAIRLDADSAFKAFGSSFIVLPDPLYGSWEKNPLP